MGRHPGRACTAVRGGPVRADGEAFVFGPLADRYGRKPVLAMTTTFFRAGHRRLGLCGRHPDADDFALRHPAGPWRRHARRDHPDGRGLSGTAPLVAGDANVLRLCHRLAWGGLRRPRSSRLSVGRRCCWGNAALAAGAAAVRAAAGMPARSRPPPASASSSTALVTPASARRPGEQFLRHVRRP